MDHLTAGCIAVSLALTVGVCTAALQAAEPRAVTLVSEHPESRLAVARLDRPPPLRVRPVPRAHTTPDPAPLEEGLADLALEPPARPPLLGPRSLRPGTEVVVSEPWALSGVPDDLCTTGTEAHCPKATGPLDAVSSGPAIGALPEGELHRVLRSEQGALLACYQRELARRPDLSGGLTIHFTISPDGSVQEATAASGPMTGTSTESCILDRFARLRFAPPAGSGTVHSSWKLLLTPG